MSRQLDAAADRMLGQLRRPEFQPHICESCGVNATAPRSCYCDECEAEFYDEPEIDDSVRCCPDCERPNQFGEVCSSCLRERGEDECQGHPAGPFDPMGETVYCDGSCCR